MLECSFLPKQEGLPKHGVTLSTSGFVKCVFLSCRARGTISLARSPFPPFLSMGHRLFLSILDTIITEFSSYCQM